MKIKFPKKRKLSSVPRITSKLRDLKEMGPAYVSEIKRLREQFDEIDRFLEKQKITKKKLAKSLINL